jgi:hypothetical protein
VNFAERAETIVAAVEDGIPWGRERTVRWVLVQLREAHRLGIERSAKKCCEIADRLQKSAWDARGRLDFNERDRLEAQSDGAGACDAALLSLASDTPPPCPDAPASTTSWTPTSLWGLAFYLAATYAAPAAGAARSSSCSATPAATGCPSASRATSAAGTAGSDGTPRT